MTYLLFIVGITLLIKGADWLVNGSSSIAKRFGIPTLIIGLTIVAFGTSMPELIVSIMAALEGKTDVAFGNVVGSNMANILLILGAAAVIYPLRVKRSTIWKEVPFSLLAALVLLIISNDLLIDELQIFSLTRVDGLVLLTFFAVFLYYIVEVARSQRSKVAAKEVGAERQPMWRSLVLILVGIIGLWLGGMWVVDGASLIAVSLGASPYLIAATIVAVGTSLPELVTSVTAALKKDTDLAVGNVVGSNIFNIFWILGITSLIEPVEIPSAINTDVIFLLLVTGLLFFFMFIGTRHKLTRGQGALFLVLYAAYISFIIFRG